MKIGVSVMTEEPANRLY